MWIDIIFLWIIIATYKEFAQHPIVWPSGNSTPHPLFLCPNLNGRRIKDVWFTTSPIGHNDALLSSLLDPLKGLGM